MLDQEGRDVRGFIPKTALGDLPTGVKLGSLIRERILAASS